MRNVKPTAAVRADSDADLAALKEDLNQQYKPADVTEQFLVDTLIHNQWRIRRLRLMEAALEANSHVLTPDGADLKRLHKIIDTSERNCRRALRQLERSRIESRKSGRHHRPAFEPIDDPYLTIVVQ